MKSLRYTTTLAYLIFFSSIGLNAQVNDTILAIVPQVNAETPPANTKEKKVSRSGKTTPTYYRHHKKLSATYSGYGIEIITSDIPLRRDHPLFQQFGNVHYEKLEGGGYAYVLLVKFSSKKALKNYTKQFVIPKAPEAKALVYKWGKRK